MRGSAAKRGTHGLRKRCPKCKKLRKFCVPPDHVRLGWTKFFGRWICASCTTIVSAHFQLTEDT